LWGRLELSWARVTTGCLFALGGMRPVRRPERRDSPLLQGTCWEIYTTLTQRPTTPATLANPFTRHAGDQQAQITSGAATDQEEEEDSCGPFGHGLMDFESFLRM